MGAVYKKYHIFKNSEYKGTMDMKGAMKLIGTSQATVSKYASNGKLYKGTWRIEEQMAEPGSETSEKRRALEEWDEVRFRLNPKARREEKG